MTGRKYAALLAMQSLQRASPSRLKNLQDRLVRRLYSHALTHVPLYRDMYRKLDLRKTDVGAVEDLAKLPVIDKSELRAVSEEARIDEGARRETDLVTIRTSGSTGQPFAFPIDHRYDQYRKAQSLRAQLASGRRLFDRVLRLSDVDPDLRGRARSKETGWFRRIGLLNEYHLFPDGDMETQIAEIERIRPDVIHAYGSTLALIVARAREHGTKLYSPRLILTDSELLLAQQRKEIETGFGAPVRDIYGSYETDNIAYECPKGGGYHLTTDSVVVEILIDGAPAPIGEPGDVVCTVLHNLTSPFIRYRLGDVAVLAEQECECKTSFPTMRMVHGRADDYAVDAAGRRISPRSFLARFDALASVREYQIHQLARDNFVVTVVPASGALGDDTRGHITENIREVFPTADVDIRIADRLDRNIGGKLRVFTCALRSEPHDPASPEVE